MAEGVAERGGAGQGDGVLEEATGRRAGVARSADGQGATGGAELSREFRIHSDPRRVGEMAEEDSAGGKSDLVHGDVGGVRRAARPLQRAGGHSGGKSDSQPYEGGGGGTYRVLRQHAGAEGEGGKGNEFQGFG